MAFAALVVLGYLLGSCPWGYWLVRLVQHEDIRKVGSGNIGATNVWRTYGRWLGAPGRPARRAEGVRARAARDAVRLAASPRRDRAPAPRRCSATGGRSSCASRRAGRWSRPAAASSSASRLWVALSGRRRLARRVPASSATRRSRRSSRASRCRCSPALYGYPTSVVVFGVGAAAAILFLHRANLRRLRAGHREPLPLPRAAQLRRVRRLARHRRRSGRRPLLGCAPGAFAAGWCGAGETAADRPDVDDRRADPRDRARPGRRRRQLRGRRRRARRRRRVDLAWWQGQDPTRAPRFDQAAFRRGTCPDISFVRLPEQPARVRCVGRVKRVQRVAQRPRARRVRRTRSRSTSSTTTGPSVEANICGTGGGDFDSGPSFAIIWLHGCTDVPSDTIAAHELLHALGALPDGRAARLPATAATAAIRATRPRTSSTRTPRAGRSAQLVLDVNHDDYYAHSAARGPTSRTRSGCTASTLRPGAARGLRSRRRGHGHERPAGRRLRGAVHDAVGPGRRAGADGEPAASDRFVRWSGACTGNGDCVAHADAGRSP